MPLRGVRNGGGDSRVWEEGKRGWEIERTEDHEEEENIDQGPRKKNHESII